MSFDQEKKQEVSHEEYTADSIEETVSDVDFEKATIRRVDLRLLLVLGLTYAISLIDRTNVSVARVAGMGTALDLQIGSRYSIITLIFFIPYIILELPSMILMRRVGCRLWLSGIVLCWGTVMIGMGFVQSWVGLVICRALLGVFESGFFPACVFLITTWYIRREVAKRLSFFYLTSQALSGFSNIIGYGMSLLDGQGGIAGWQWIFVLFGAFTVFCAVLCFFFIVDFPDKNTFLNERQTNFIMKRIEEDRGDSVADKMTLRKVGTHLCDWKGWASACLFAFATTPSYAFAYFLPVVLAGGGYSVKMALLLSAPPYLTAAIYTIVVAIYSDKTGKRGIFVGLNCTVCLIGLFIMAFTRPIGIRYLGAFLSVAGAKANVPMILSYQSNNVRSHTKRAVHSALVIGFGGIGGIMASTIFRQADFPRYLPGIATTAACQVLSLCILLASDFAFRRANAKAARGEVVLEGLEGFRYTR